MIFTACLTGCGENTNNEPSGVTTPANLTAIGTGGPPPRIFLNWSASNGAVSYQIYRDGALVLSPIRTGSQAVDTTVVAHAWYCYSITATDASGHESLRSDPVCTSTDATRIATLTASSETVVAGQSSVITANVTDADDNAVSGETVTFTIAVNESGATFSNGGLSVQATTDSGGNAVAVYVAGNNDAIHEVFDTVRAALTNGSSNAVVMTRSAGTVFTGYVLTVTANPDTLTSRTGSSLVTANLKDNLGTAVFGVNVTFSVGACAFGTVVPGPVPTDGAGNAVTSFTGVGLGSCVVTATSAPIGGNTYMGAATITVP
jgi:hypothetical protein